MCTDNYLKHFRLLLTLTLCVWSCSKASKQNLRNDFEHSVETNEFGTINLDGRNDECKLHHVFRETAAGLTSRTDLIKTSRASSDHIHEVIFAIQGNGLDDLTELLHDISDPNSESYGQHMTRDQIEQISSNSASRDIVITHLREVGAQIVSISAYGEYITAQAPVSVWEKSFDTEFYTFDHTHTIDSTPTQVIRAEKYSVPASLHEHLAYVFHTVQMPLAIWGKPIMHLLRNSSSNIFASVASGSVSPTLLNEFYNIRSNRGTTKSSQAVYETIGQNLSPKDLTRFQTYFGLPLEPVTTLIGGQVSDDLCIKSPESCTEANLDTQYLMAISQGSPTTHWYTDLNSFAAWLLTVASYADPPRVISISYGASESTVTKSEFDAFNVQAIKLGLMGVTIFAASGGNCHESHHVLT
jgi:tripeptidyl-peptidase I